MKILEYMERYGYEQLVLCHDSGLRLTAIIAIHDTTLGPSLGGVRVWDYPSEEEAVLDALRLARAMSYKSAAAGVNLGGGKAVMVGTPAPEKREACFRALGRFVESLSGRYIVTEDVGSYVQDMEYIRTETSFVTGLPVEMGGSGDPSPLTSLGIYQALRACAEEVFGSPSLKGKRIAVQGLGKVGSYLLPYLAKEEAKLIVTDVKEGAAQKAAREFNAQVVAPDQIYDVDCDIFSPCALGAVLNRNTIPRLRCKIVCGGANNQLQEDGDGAHLEQRGILYAPDFVANAGGIINISVELTGYDAELAQRKVKGIYDTMRRVLARSKAQKVPTARAADLIAEERIAAVKGMKPLYQGGI